MALWLTRLYNGRSDGKKGNDRKMLFPILLKENGHRRAPGREAYKIAMRHLKSSPRSGLDAKWLIF